MGEAVKMRTEHAEDGRVTEQVWSLPLDESFLEGMLRDLFERHWAKLTFGPMVQGGAYELRCPAAPERIGVSGGYFTVHWGRGGHFHLCIGESDGAPELVADRRPSCCELVRGFDGAGAPVTWSLRMENGRSENTCSIYFPNPFLTDEDGLADAPDWSRLDLWHHVLDRYAGHAPDGLDTTGRGFH